MSKLNDNGTLTIEAYSFADFLAEFQEAVINGFYLDLESNENYPQKYGDHLFVVLKGVNEVVAPSDEPTDFPEVVADTPMPVVKPAGRPRKATV